MGVDAGRDDVAADLFARLEDDAGGAAVFVEDFSDGGVGANFDAQFPRGSADGVGDRTGAAAAETPGAERTIDFTHVVMQENVGGARRTDAEKGTDDAGGGHGGFEDVGFKPLVEEVGGAHGHELGERVAFIGAEFAKTLQQEVELLEILWIQRGGIRRNYGEHGLHEAAHRRHHFGEFVVGFGIEAGVAANFALRFGVVVDTPEVVAIEHGGKGAVERKNFEAVVGQIQFANDFGAEQRDYVGTFREQEAWDDFFGDCGAAEDAAPFEDQHFFPSFRQISGVHETIVTASDDDHIVGLRHSLELQNEKEDFDETWNETFY